MGHECPIPSSLSKREDPNTSREDIVDGIQALHLIQSASQWYWESHAIQRMHERDVYKADVKQAVATATACVAATTPGAWLITGLDRLGEPLRVSVTIEQILPRGTRNVVITVMDL